MRKCLLVKVWFSLWFKLTCSGHNSRVVKVVISVLLREKSLTQRNIYEALLIKELNPEINIKYKMNDALKFLYISNSHYYSFAIALGLFSNC